MKVLHRLQSPSRRVRRATISVQGRCPSPAGPGTRRACWEHLARIATFRQAAAIDVVDLAVTLGLGEGLHRGAPISRTLARMVAFGTAKRTGDTLAVRLALPDLPEHQAGRLSYSARKAHEHLAYFHQGRKP